MRLLEIRRGILSRDCSSNVVSIKGQKHLYQSAPIFSDANKEDQFAENLHATKCLKKTRWKQKHISDYLYSKKN